MIGYVCVINDLTNLKNMFNALCVYTKGKGKGQYICIAPYCRQPTSKAFRYGNALSRDLTVLPVHPRVYGRNDQHLPTVP